MRRRLDLGAALVHRPPVLFLDEPTTGLDPASRNDLWVVIQELVADGTTVLLTTQYLEEADRLADLIAVIDGGRKIAEGTSAELKATLGATIVEIAVADHADSDPRRRACWPRSGRSRSTTTATPSRSTSARAARGVLDVARILERRPAGARQLHRARAHARRRLPAASPATAEPTADRRRRAHDRSPTRRGGRRMTATQLSPADLGPVASGVEHRSPFSLGGARLARPSPGATSSRSPASPS